MIPEAAVKEYLEAHRDNHIWIKGLKREELLDNIADLRPRPDLFKGMHIHQLACFLLGVAYPQFAFWLDMGCISGDTLIETSAGPIRVDQLALRGEPFSVLSNTSKGLAFVPADPPFCKGRAKLFLVKFASGREITVSADHVFLTERGWISCAELSSGERLPVFSSSPPRSNSAFSPLMSQQDAEHCLEIPLGYLDRCYSHFRGEQLPLGLDSGPGLFPFLDETLVHNRFLSQMDVPASKYKCSSLRGFYPLSRHGFLPLLEYAEQTPVLVDKEYSVLEYGFGQYSRWFGAGVQSRVLLDPVQLVAEDLGFLSGFSDLEGNSVSTGAYTNEYIFGLWEYRRPIPVPSREEFCVAQQAVSIFANPCRTPSVEFDSIVYIEEKGEGVYYDLSVPIYHNYIAQGLCHHNSGKTLITLELLKYWRKCGRLRRGLIFVTSDKAFPTWEKQIKLYNANLPFTFLEGSFKDKWQAWEEFGDGLMFLTYPGASSFVTKTVKEKGKKNTWEIDDDLVQHLRRDLDAIVMDESTRAAHHTSLAFKLISKLGSTVPIRYGLAGRPFGRDPTLLWAQHKLIDGGDTLGPTLGMFRAAFFSDKPNRFVPKRQQKYIRNYTFDKRKEPKLSQLIQHRSITYAESECIDVPKWTPIIEEVRFSGEAEAFYQRAVDTIIQSKGNGQVVKNLFMKMRQLSSGFVGFKDDETGARAEIEFSENPKFDRLMELLDQLPRDRKAVVFYEFTYSGRKIFEAAKKELGFKPIWLWSGTKDPRRDLHEFETSLQPELAIINNKVGAYSLDGLQEVANYTFFYESPVSCIDREQAERRLRRQGQKRRVWQYDLVTQGSMDQRILDYHREGRDLVKALLHDPAKVVRR